MSSRSSRSRIRRRSSRAVRHCSSGRTRATSRITVSSRVIASTPCTSGLAEEDRATSPPRRRISLARPSSIAGGRPLDVGPRVDRDVEHDLREALALVADAHDLAVAHVPDRAVDVAQPGRAQPDRLDRAARLLEVDDVADAVLVLEHHEHAGQEVLDDVLRAEAERDADDRRAGDERRRGRSAARSGSA